MRIKTRIVCNENKKIGKKKKKRKDKRETSILHIKMFVAYIIKEVSQIQ